MAGVVLLLSFVLSMFICCIFKVSSSKSATTHSGCRYSAFGCLRIALRWHGGHPQTFAHMQGKPTLQPNVPAHTHADPMAL